MTSSSEKPIAASESAGLSADDVFETAIGQYSNNLQALRDFISSVEGFLAAGQSQILSERSKDLMPLAIAIQKLTSEKNASPEMSENLDKLMAKYGEVVIEEIDGKKSAQFNFSDPELSEAFADAMGAFAAFQQKKNLLFESSLITLISSAEWFLSQALQSYFKAFPESLGNLGPISIRDIKRYASVDDIVQESIYKKVESVMRESQESWIGYIRTTIQCSLDEIKPLELKLSEIYQRRNLIVHNGGLMNDIYRSRVDEALYPPVLPDGRIVVDRNYLNEALNIYEASFTCVAGELWRKISKKCDARATLFVNSSVEALKQDRWMVAEMLAAFVKDDKRSYSESLRMMATINYWQSFKWSGRFDKVKSEVKAADFSAALPIYKIAQWALLDESARVFKALPDAIRSEELDREGLESWPIFRGIRDDDRFKKILARLASSKKGATLRADTPKAKKPRRIRKTSQP